MNNNKKLNKVAGFIIAISLVSGVVYAGVNYENIKKYVIGGGIDKAAQNGYISDVEMEYNKQETELVNKQEAVIDNVDVDFKINDFTMDDTNLCMNYSFKLGDNIDEYLNLDKLHKFVLKDLTILDEESNVLFDKSYGVNIVKTKVDRADKTVDILYNMFGNDKYPKSKKLFLKFSQIEMTEYNENLDFNTEKAIVLKGDWQVELEVPEIIYNRTSESYKVASVSNANFKVHTALLTETGFEFGTIIENCEDMYNKVDISEMVNELGNLYKSVKDDSFENTEEKEMVIANYKEYENILQVVSMFRLDAITQKREATSYVKNANGDIFSMDETPGKTQKYSFIADNIYDFTVTFQMTKSEASDRITVVLDYRGEIVTIELEKA